MTSTVYPKLYILARMEIQLASLNASGSIGNYIKLQEGYVAVRRDSGIDYVPVPVITGNALKNWHAREMAGVYVNELGGTRIHADHFRDMMRVALDGHNIKSDSVEDVEAELVSGCSLCDVHGFLAIKGKEDEKEGKGGGAGRKGRGEPEGQKSGERKEESPARRESLVKFSFAVPPEELVAGGRSLARLKFPITHNRVSPKHMMVFKREYGTLELAWQATLDLASVGRSQLVRDAGGGLWLGRLLVEDRCELARRGVAAVLAFKALMGGWLGSSTSRALPIAKTRELVAILAAKPIPVPPHPFYMDYASELAELLKRYQDRIDSVHYLEGGAFASQASGVENLLGGRLKPAKGYSVLLERAAERVRELLSGDACRHLKV